ncbi:DUF3016 domain-containing protein [Parashewanella curva]|uniref:DUF3016 domain-containing protein n=1 Tax=Parashewanella curva TaxID=2338552 RepID=A0A3L8PRX7_9GAMM|nr:DUF3016 domain-containing protein [Parashewanella curva]RLV58151.1 DUF3016 domain-containing protein [Parashewanella curva]
MKHLIYAFTGLFLLAGCASKPAPEPTMVTTTSGKVTINWKEPSKFTDIKSSGELQSRFEKRLFDSLTKDIDKTASKFLRPDQKLELKVTNLDLAGDVRPTFGATSDDIRIVKGIYPPRIKFSYKVTVHGNIVSSGTQNLSDLAFQDRIVRDLDRPFVYEKNLINRWLTRTLKPQLAK